MKRATLCVLLLLLSSCFGAKQAVRVDEQIAPSDCATPQVQRLLTFCASPQAADLARSNAELMSAPTASKGDVPYSPLPIGDAPVRGPEDAPVTIVMFTDLECPYCQQMHENVEALADGAPEDVRLVFKHTPLSFHPNAVPAALAALAAREQGKFWEYVDRIYAHQDALSREALLEHAAALGLDTEQFRNDFGSQSHIGAIEADLGLAGQVGVSGTPTLFVNGIRVVGVYPTHELRALVEQQKELAKRLEDAGVPEKDIYWRLVATQYQAAEPVDYEAAAAEEVEPPPVVAFVPAADAPSRGAEADASLVTVVEFSDFQCPFCARANAVVEDVMAKFPNDARLVFRHYPLPNHPDAMTAAVASVAAHQDGKFWEFHDRLFAAPEDLSPDALLAHAKEVGLDAKKVERAIDDPKLQARVVADQKLGYDIGIRGTPTFFVNGVMMLGIESPEDFEAMIAEQAEVARTVREETGLAGEELYRAIVEHNKKAVAQP